MCCFITGLLLGGPRLGVLIWWLVAQNRFGLVYDTFIWPLLGIIFLPWTLLVYTIAWRPGGLSGLGWFFLILAFVVDVGSLAGGAWRNRERVPGVKDWG
jgi:hypothetical protein